MFWSFSFRLVLGGKLSAVRWSESASFLVGDGDARFGIVCRWHIHERHADILAFHVPKMFHVKHFRANH